MKKIIIVLLIFLLVGCTKSVATPNNKTQEAVDIATNFINALSQGDIDKAASFVEESIQEEYLSMGFVEIILKLYSFGYPQEAIEIYADYYVYLLDNLYRQLSNFKVEDVWSDENGHYEVNGTIDTINFDNLSELIYEDDLDENDLQEIKIVNQNDGSDKALILYMQKIVDKMTIKLDHLIQETESENISVCIWLEDTDNGIKVMGDSLFNTDYYYDVVIDYNSHGISTRLDDNWYRLSYEESQGSNYAVANDSFNNTTYCELYFFEQMIQITQEEYNDYIKNDMVNIMKEHFSSYETSDVELVTVSINNKEYYAIHVDAIENGNHIYELNIPVLTDDDNHTIIGITTYYNDLTYDVLKLINIE